MIVGTTDEVQIGIFDYKYTTGGGKQSHTHHQTIGSLQSNDLVIPNFVIRPETLFSRMGGMLGFKDINFESHPDFSRMFTLKGNRPVDIQAFFTPAILDFFESQKGICVEARSGAIVFYWPGKRIKPDEVKKYLAIAYELFGLAIESSGAR